MSEQPFTYEERSARVIRALLSRAEELAAGSEGTAEHLEVLRWEATVADLERQLADFVKANNEVGQRCADLEINLVAARKRIGWWEELWEMARNLDPQLEFLRDKFAAEEG